MACMNAINACASDSSVSLAPVPPATQIRLVRLGTGGSRPRQLLALFTRQLRDQRAAPPVRRWNLRRAADPPPARRNSPPTPARRHYLDQLHRDADPVAEFLDSSLEHKLDPQFTACEPAHRSTAAYFITALVTSDRDSSDVAQLRDQRIGDAEPQVSFRCAVGPEQPERQHGHRAGRGLCDGLEACRRARLIRNGVIRPSRAVYRR